MVSERLKWLLLINPNLDCSNCFKMYREAGLVPLCKREVGCEIEHLAANREVHNRVKAFMQYKALNISKALPELQREALKKSGLYDDFQSLIESENIYAQYVNNKRAEQARKKR